MSCLRWLGNITLVHNYNYCHLILYSSMRNEKYMSGMLPHVPMKYMEPTIWCEVPVAMGGQDDQNHYATAAVTN